MTIGMDIAAALPGLQAEAESRMRDICVITETDSLAVWNPDTLEYDYSGTVIYTGKCRIRLRDVAAQTVEQAGQVARVQDLVLSLPISDPDTALVGKGHVVTVTASDDAALVGKKFTVGVAAVQSQATARRFPIEVFQ